MGKSLSITLISAALVTTLAAAGANADDYTACIQAGQQHDAIVSRLRMVMQLSSGCAGEPGFEASKQADKAYYSTPRGQACREARSICNNLKPEIGLHHCGRFLRSGLGYPDQITIAKRVNAALSNAYGDCPAQ